VVAIDEGALEGEGELDGVLDDVLVELVVEEGVRVLLPRHRLHAQHVLFRLLLAHTHIDIKRHQYHPSPIASPYAPSTPLSLARGPKHIFRNTFKNTETVINDFKLHVF
jgi:hypothetical protein